MGLIKNVKGYFGKQILQFSKGGVVVGKGDFPVYVIREAKEKGLHIVGFGIKEITNPRVEKEVDEMVWFELGQIRDFIKTLKEKKIKYLTVAGLIPHKLIYNYEQFDDLARKLLKKAPSRRADDILKTFATELHHQGIKLVDSTLFLSKYLVQPTCYTEHTPDKIIREDIDFGLKIAKRIAALDIGQTVIVKDKGIIAVEAIEGTDATIRRAGKYVDDFCLIKVSKPKQDLRFDVPVIGLGTIRNMIAAGGKVIAISAHKALFFDQPKVIQKANEHGIIVLGLKDQ